MNRRTLLGGAAATATALAAERIGAADRDRRIGFAIVGLGLYGRQVIIPRFAECRHSRLAAVVSGDPAKARAVASEHELPARSVYSYADFDRIRDDPDVDVVYVCLPNSMHAEYTVRAFQAGKHVLCEKPMAVSVAEGERMVAAGKAANRRLMIGYRCHFEPFNLEATRIVRSGGLGRVRYVRSEHGFVMRDPNVWRLKRALSGGGALMDIGIYALQAARYLTGEEPVAVTARESTDRTDPRFREVEDQIAWEMAFPSGALAGCHTMYSANQNRILVAGSDGRLEMEPATRYEGNRMWTGRDGRERSVTPPPGPGRSQFAGQLDHMAECVMTGREPIVGGAEGLRDLRIMEAIYRSAREGRTVDLARPA